jgi:TonB family protein
MLTEPTTQLERRILAMRNTTKRLVTGTVYGSGAVALASLAFASSLQSATMNVAVKAVTLPEIAAPTVLRLDVTKTTAAKPAARRQQGNPAPRYPDMLRAANVEGAVVVRFSTDAKGVPDSSSIVVLTSTHDLFSGAVRKALPQWHLAPNSSMSMPFVFVMANKTAAELGEMTKGIAANAVVVTATPVNVGVAGNTAARANNGPTPMNDNQTYFEFQVEKQATPYPDNPGARYPDVLRAANVEGSVLAQFVLGPDGYPDMDTFKVLKSDHDLFTQAVKSALPNMRFYPAQVGGLAVKQLVQMPFSFSLSKQP